MVKFETEEELNNAAKAFIELETFIEINFISRLYSYIYELEGISYGDFEMHHTYIKFNDIHYMNKEPVVTLSVRFKTNDEVYFSSTIPLKYYTYSYEHLDKIVLEKRMQREREAQLIIEANRQQKENAEYQQFLKLKAKFENENSNN